MSIEGTGRHNHHGRNTKMYPMDNGINGIIINGETSDQRTISGATTAAATSKVTLERSKTHENI